MTATQSPNGDYVPWKYSSRKKNPKVTHNIRFWILEEEKTKIRNFLTGGLSKWKRQSGNSLVEMEFRQRNFHREMNHTRKEEIKNSPVISFNVSLSRHWGWPRTSSSRPRDFERCSQFVCLLLRNFNSNTKKNQNVDDWPSWPTTNSKNTRIFVRLHYNELIQNLPFHVRMQILTRHHLLWVMADFVRGPGCGSCSLVAVSLQFISGWQEVVARTRFEAESK
jgi:hypothetical protein